MIVTTFEYENRYTGVNLIFECDEQAGYFWTGDNLIAVIGPEEATNLASKLLQYATQASSAVESGA